MAMRTIPIYRIPKPFIIFFFLVSPNYFEKYEIFSHSICQSRYNFFQKSDLKFKIKAFFTILKVTSGSDTQTQSYIEYIEYIQ